MPSFTPEQLQLYSKQYQIYWISGLIAIIANLFILIVLLSKKDLRHSFPFLIALSVADGLNGVAFVTGGFGSNDAILYHPVKNTAMSCLAKPRVIVGLIGAQLPAFLTISVSIERFLAVIKPLWFKAYWSTAKRYQIILACFVLSGLSVCAAVPFAYSSGNATVTSTGVCTMQQATGNYYSSAHFVLITLIHATAFIINIIAYRIARHVSRVASSGLRDVMSAEIKQIRTIAAIAFFSVLLIAVPNIFYLLMNYSTQIFGPTLGDTLWDNAGYVFVFFCFNSFINIFIYFCLSRKFRQRAIQLLTCSEKYGTNITGVMSFQTAPK